MQTLDRKDATRDANSRRFLNKCHARGVLLLNRCILNLATRANPVGLKTILGFFHANVLSQHGRKIAEVQKIMNPTIETAFSTGHLAEPCGTYVQKNATTLVQRGVLDFMSLSDERGERIVGCGLTIVGIATTFIMDPGMSNRT